MPFDTAPFAPSYNRGIIVTPAVASASTTISGNSQTLCLTNLGANVCYVRLSDVATTASTADYPIPGGAQVTISKPREYGILAHISAAGTSLHIIPGEGF